MKEENKKPEPRAQSPEPCKQCDEYLSGWKRALADYDNLKKDLARERTQMRVHATERAALAILPVLDHFDEALKHEPQELHEKAKQWVSGVLHVRRELEEALHELGLEPFSAVDDAFDPLKHEAGAERHDPTKPPNTVLEVIRRGWKLGDRIVRPAKVIINISK